MEMIPTHAEVIEGYGLTECSPVLTLRRAKVDLGVGKLLKGIDCLIVDPESYQPLPLGKAGVILVRGPSIFEGYYRSSIDPFKWINGQKWFDTQDLGFLDEKGYLHLQGRRSRTAKIGGEMISLPLLEDVIVKEFRSKFPALQVAIIGQSDPKKGSHLVLVTNSELILEEVNHALNKAGLSPLLKIAVIEKVASLPLTPLGKIDYKKI
jgi:long-chain-fatty-acid--[acyl-carrier-protein] ligase